MSPVDYFDAQAFYWKEYTHYMITMIVLNANIDASKVPSKHYIMDFNEFKTTKSNQTGKYHFREWKWKYPTI